MNENNQPQSQCPKCGKGPIIMFTADDDICQACGKIITPERQPSHSPTEQPGDAKHTPGQWKVDITFKKNGYYCTSLCSGDDGIIRPAIAEGLTREESIANAELIARAPALLSEVSTLRSKQAELVAENERLKSQFDFANHAAESVMRQADKMNNELQQLRSERDKMREALENIVSYVQDDIVTEHEQRLFEAAKSALSGGSK